MDSFQKIAAVIRDVLERPDLDIRPDTRARDVAGWDSFAMVKMIVLIEERFSIEFDGDTLDDIRDVGDLVNAIDRLKSLSSD